MRTDRTVRGPVLKEDDRMTLDTDRERSAFGNAFPRVVTIVGGAGFVALGVWAMISPQSFFEAVATFEPYNQHFLQDIGASRSDLELFYCSRACPAAPTA
jgi:hypothetical protein